MPHNRSNAEAATGDRTQDIPECGFSHSRKDWLQEHMDNPAVLVKQFPKHLLHMFQRHLRTNLEGNTRLHQRSSKIIKRIFVGCALIGGGGPRGNHTRQLKPKNIPNRAATDQFHTRHARYITYLSFDGSQSYVQITGAWQKAKPRTHTCE